MTSASTFCYSPTPGVVPPPPFRESDPYAGPLGRKPSYALWASASYLVACPYCQAEPFQPCHTYGEPHKLANYSHSGRSYAGHALLRQALRAAGTCSGGYPHVKEAREALEDEPPIPAVTEDDIVALVNQVIDERLKPTSRRRSTKPPARKRAAQ